MPFTVILIIFSKISVWENLSTYACEESLLTDRQAGAASGSGLQVVVPCKDFERAQLTCEPLLPCRVVFTWAQCLGVDAALRFG